MQVGFTLASSSTTMASLTLWPEPCWWHHYLIKEQHLLTQGMHLKLPVALIFGLEFTVHQIKKITMSTPKLSDVLSDFGGRDVLLLASFLELFVDHFIILFQQIAEIFSLFI